MSDQMPTNEISSEVAHSDAAQSEATGSEVADYDVAIVGASLAGCAAAIMLGRAGARVALVEKRPDPNAFKRVCTHFIQSSAIPTLERIGLLGPMHEAGALRARARLWTRWGWLEPPSTRSCPAGSTCVASCSTR